MQLALARQAGPVDLLSVGLLHVAALLAVLVVRGEPAPVGATAPITARLIEAPAPAPAPAATPRPRTAAPLAMRTPPRPPKPHAPAPQPPPRPPLAKADKPLLATTAPAAIREAAVTPTTARAQPAPKPVPVRPAVEAPPAPVATRESVEPPSQPSPPVTSTSNANATTTPATSASQATAPTAARRRATGSAGSPSDNRAYFASLLQRLERFKVYPAALRKEKIEGRVVLKFTIDAQGAVVAAAIQDSSGHTALDRAAEEMLARAAPLPAIPASMGKTSLTLSVPVEYSLLTER